MNKVGKTLEEFHEATYAKVYSRKDHAVVARMQPV